MSDATSLNDRLALGLLVAAVLFVSGCTSQTPSAQVGCKNNWICGDWGACVNSGAPGGTGIQRRTCIDANNCTIVVGKPPESRSCILPDIPPKHETSVQYLGETYASAKNWDADAQIDGIEFRLEPKDTSDKLVSESGTLKAQLFQIAYIKEYPSQLSTVSARGSLIASWENITVSETDYTAYSGAKVRLSYDSVNFDPRMLSLEYGWLDVTFVTPTNKTFNVTDGLVSLI